MSEHLQASELVLAPNGSVYHLHVMGADIADDIFLVGDPGRIELFKSMFDKIEFTSQNREISVVTGYYHGHRFTALSTGMGTDNIDIVMNELDVAANFDLTTRRLNEKHRSLNLIRIGTSGSLCEDIPTGSLVASKYAIGLDGLINYYTHNDDQLEEGLTQAFLKHMEFDSRFARPYACSCCEELIQRVGFDMHQGITVTAPGFYAPQGRHIKIAPSISQLNERLSTFSWDGIKVTNLEMEASAIYGLSRLMGHNALTVCLIIANRVAGTFLNDYHKLMAEKIELIMSRLASK